MSLLCSLGIDTKCVKVTLKKNLVEYIYREKSPVLSIQLNKISTLNPLPQTASKVRNKKCQNPKDLSWAVYKKRTVDEGFLESVVTGVIDISWLLPLLSFIRF